MSDDFIPLNQSTPVRHQKRWNNQGLQQSGQKNNWNHNQRRGGGSSGGYNNRMNNSQRSNSYGNDSNRSQGGDSIDAYLHPSMLQDPWEYLRRRNAQNQSN